MVHAYLSYLIPRLLALVGFCVVFLPQFSYASYLKNSPNYNSSNVAKLAAGDQVEIIEVTDTGWCKVRSVQTNLVGWVQEKNLVDIEEVISPPTQSDAEGANEKSREERAPRKKAKKKALPAPDAM
jgi:Bacterial SH3 domain